MERGKANKDSRARNNGTSRNLTVRLSLAHCLDDDPLGSLSVPLSIEDPLPRPKVELPLRDRDDHLVTDRE